MNIIEMLARIAAWVGSASLHASFLVVMVVLLQFTLRKRITPGWRYALWVPVLVRLLCPVFPESAFSVFNLFSPSMRTSTAAYPVISEPPQTAHPRRAHSLVHDMDVNIVDTPDLVPFPANKDSLKPSGALPQLLPCAWLAGAILSGAVMLAFHLRQRRRVEKLPTIVDPRLLRLWNESQKIFGIGGRIRLLETDSEHSPALFGLTQVRLLLPRGLGERFTDAQLRHIFLHECAHLKRWDLPLNWLLATLQCLHWFNPLLWWAWSRARADREYACDALALRNTDDEPAAYGETLIQLIEQTVPPFRQPGMVGIGEDRASLQRRIGMIARFKAGRPWTVIGITLLAIFSWSALTDTPTTRVAADRPAETSSAAVPDTNNTVVVLYAIDAMSGRGIEGAKFQITIRVPGSPVTSLELDSGTDGSCQISVPETKRWVLQVRCEKVGFVPLKYTSLIESSPVEIPFELHTAASGEGIITDYHGLPVTNASVRIIPNLLPGSFRRDPQPDLQDRTFLTDTNGRWYCNLLVDSPSIRYHLTFTHATHIEDFGFSQFWNSRISLADLKGGKHVTAAKPGGQLRGRVTNQLGDPIPNATLELRRNPPPYTAEEPQISRIDGSYDFDAAIGKGCLLTVYASGFAPAAIRIHGEQGMDPTDITLTNSVPLQGQVIDPQGNPIEGVSVHLSRIGNFYFSNNEWVLTDKGGEFTYKDAPAGPAHYSFSKYGFEYLGDQILAPTGELQRVTLQAIPKPKPKPFLRSVSFQGKVVNAITKAALTTFDVTPGVRGPAKTNTLWHTGYAQRVVNGRHAGFRVRTGDRPGEFRFIAPPDLSTNELFKLRITAPGYAPTESDWLNANAIPGTLEMNPATDSEVAPTQIRLPLKSGDLAPDLLFQTVDGRAVPTHGAKKRQLFIFLFTPHTHSIETIERRLQQLGLAAKGKNQFELLALPVDFEQNVLEKLIKRHADNWAFCQPSSEQLSQLGFGDKARRWNRLPGLLHVGSSGKIASRGFSLDLDKDGFFELLVRLVNGEFRKPTKK